MREIIIALGQDEKEIIVRFVRSDEENTPVLSRVDACLEDDVCLEDKKRNILKEILKKLGVAPYFNGYSYLIDAIIFYSSDCAKYNRKIIKELYEAVATKHNTDRKHIERGIQTVISKMFKLPESVEMFCDKFNFTCNSKNNRPKASEFIMVVSEYLNSKK